MFRIRFHGRGGQGMKTAANIVGSAFFAAGFEVQDAPRYGAERRGAPMTAYVRAAHDVINERGAITRPDLVVVADETLVTAPAAGVLQGCEARTVLLIVTEQSAGAWQSRLKYPGPLLAFPAGGETVAGRAPSVLSAWCAGAAACLTGVIGWSAVQVAVRAELGGRAPGAVEPSVTSALAGFDALRLHAGTVVEGGVSAPAGYAAPDWIEIPADDAAIAAPDIRAAATSETSITGLWRTLRPVIEYASCNRCSWICSTLCPDSAIDVEADRTPRIDYDHCKGCMICVAVCPPHAIRAEPEHRALAEGATP